MSRMAVPYVRRLALGATVLVLLVVLAGCHPSRQGASIDRSILTDDPCAAPCWQGIVPGKTTSHEAAGIVAGLDSVRSNDIRDFGDRLVWYSAASRADPVLASELRSRDGAVAFIEISISFELTLQAILDKYGPPEKILAFESGSEHPILTAIHYYYPQQGLVFVSWIEGYVPPSEQFVLDAATPITRTYYFAPTTIDSWFEEHPEMEGRMRFGKEHLRDWPGLGPVDVLH